MALRQALDEIGDIELIRADLEPDLIGELDAWMARVDYDRAAIALTVIGAVTLLSVTVLLYI